MAETVSKETLKAALAELVQTDREFFISLISDTLAHAMASAEPVATIKNKQNKRKPLPAKVEPAYRKGSTALMDGLAIKKEALLNLRALFSDQPPAEEIIAALSK